MNQKIRLKKTKIQDKKIHQIQKIKVTPQIKKIILNLKK